MSNEEFARRTALVTGGSRGIGRAVCLRLARGGARIALNYAGNDAAARETQQRIEATGGLCTLFKADVADPDAVTAMIEGATRALGPIDLLVTCAGITRMEPHDRMTFETWRRIQAVNLDGSYLPIMAVKDGMLRRGYGGIVCISSIGALRPRGRQIAYCAAKAGVIAMARCFAEALAPAVRVNCVAPGLTETDMLGDLDPAMLPERREAIPLKRFGRPEEVAETVAFLLSERASLITGQTIVASGGEVMLP